MGSATRGVDDEPVREGSLPVTGPTQEPARGAHSGAAGEQVPGATKTRMGQPPETTTGQQQAFDVDAWARDRARAKLGRVLLRQSQRKANARPPAATPPPLPLTATIPPPEAAAALDPVQAARRLQRVARRRIATRRSIEEAMRAFARDYETRPPLQWEKPRPDDNSLAEVKRRLSLGDDESTVLSRLSLDSLPSSQGEPSHATTQSRASLTQRPACSPIPERRRRRKPQQKLPPVVNWGCPVDTSSSALLSRPLRRKNARLTLPRPPLKKTTAQSAGPAKDAADAMERLALDTNALLTASLTEKLEDEHYRTTVAYALEKTAAGRRYHALERHRARVAFQRVKFDCQVAMVMQLRDNGFLR